MDQSLVSDCKKAWEAEFGVSLADPKTQQQIETVHEAIQETAAKTKVAMRPRTLDVDQCPSCGQPHKAIQAIALYGFSGRYTHQLRCPTTGDWIPIRLANDADKSTAFRILDRLEAVACKQSTLQAILTEWSQILAQEVAHEHITGCMT
jgi:hypothetical protein